MTQLAIAIDLGGTNLRGAAVSADGTIVFETRRPTHAEQGVDEVVDRLALTIREVSDKAGVGPEVAVGIAAPGPLDPRDGVVFFAPNLPGWHDVPLRDRLETLTGRRVYLGNDANAAALGELYFGAGKGVRNLVYCGLGTGFGGGVVSEGILIDGWRGMGTELGHVCVDLDGPRCHCGGIGCLEAFCSAWAITESAEQLVASGRGAAILAAAAGGEISPVAVGAAAAAGDAAAIALLERAGRALGAGLAIFVNIFNPELLVVGGGVAEIGESLLDPARRALDIYAMPAMRAGVRLIGSQLGTKTGTYGAAALVFHAGT